MNRGVVRPHIRALPLVEILVEEQDDVDCDEDGNVTAQYVAVEQLVVLRVLALLVLKVEILHLFGLVSVA